jgi:outer membrane protein OmpA-like peptidoglycan-associated protein
MAVSQGGITNLLRAQSKEITEATPSEVSHILGFGGRPVTAPAPTALYEEKVVSGARNWLPLLLVGLVALGLLGYWLSRRAAPPRVVETARPVAETAAPAVVPTPTVSGNLDQYLASGVPDVPRTFIFDNLNFETASTQLTQGSGQTVANLAAILKAHPTAQIQLAGHTDNTGNPQTNQQLSLDRANAVKAMLVNDGISANRVATVGYGQDRPVASNDSEEGRARNRRTELTVTSK